MGFTLSASHFVRALHRVKSAEPVGPAKQADQVLNARGSVHAAVGGYTSDVELTD